MADPVRIFVSHSHEDNAWCREFVAGLRQVGADVWYDEHNLGYGQLSQEIEREMKTRPVFIVVVSPLSIVSPWVQREVDAAMRLRDKGTSHIILPVMAQKCEIPLFWGGYKYVSGPGDSGLPAAYAATRVMSTLLQSSQTPVNPSRVSVASLGASNPVQAPAIPTNYLPQPAPL